MEGPIQRRTGMEDERSKRRLFQTYNKPSGCFTYPNNTENTQSADVSSIMGAHGKNHPPNVTQLLGFHGNQSDSQQKDGIRKNRHYITAKRGSLRHQESYGTATDSYSNRGSDSDSDSEEYSLTDRSGEYVSSSWSESGTESQYNSYTGNSENDVIYSSASSVADHKLTSSSSEGYSSFDQPIRSHARSTYSSTSKKSGPSKTRKANGKNRKKQTGMWKRMKDKMAIIFHHHHHHHHHHHNRDGKDQTSSSLQKRKGKVINFNRRDEEAYGEKTVGKMRKSLVHEKNQQSHFHGLMEGFLRHVRHSKQSKPGKETNIGELAKGHHGKQKTLNKSHWWKLMQHHRRTKLQNKTNVKLGLGKKKARLKALPR
ncbi:hypothetical protein DH2020_012600 [Rehmannia glutinosa]|uniref:Uncharacterized protein n=1 Tax=Rehmannia glutinosa TaxID=99300 RepID=A0ABR0X087_REHGL